MRILSLFYPKEMSKDLPKKLFYPNNLPRIYSRSYREILPKKAAQDFNQTATQEVIREAEEFT